MMQYFLGINRSVGEMTAEDGRKITWDNILIERCQDIDLERKEGGGYVSMDPVTIKFADFSRVTGGMDWMQLAQEAKSHILDPIFAVADMGDKNQVQRYCTCFRFCDKNGNPIF